MGAYIPRQNSRFNVWSLNVFLFIPTRITFPGLHRHAVPFIQHASRLPTASRLNEPVWSLLPLPRGGIAEASRLDLPCLKAEGGWRNAHSEHPACASGAPPPPSRRQPNLAPKCVNASNMCTLLPARLCIPGIFLPAPSGWPNEANKCEPARGVILTEHSTAPRVSMPPSTAWLQHLPPRARDSRPVLPLYREHDAIL